MRGNILSGLTETPCTSVKDKVSQSTSTSSKDNCQTELRAHLEAAPGLAWAAEIFAEGATIMGLSFQRGEA